MIDVEQQLSLRCASVVALFALIDYAMVRLINPTMLKDVTLCGRLSMRVLREKITSAVVVGGGPVECEQKG